MAPESAGALAIDRCHQGIISGLCIYGTGIRLSVSVGPKHPVSRSFPVCPTFSRCYGRNLESILNVEEHVLLIQHI